MEKIKRYNINDIVDMSKLLNEGDIVDLLYTNPFFYNDYDIETFHESRLIKMLGRAYIEITYEKDRRIKDLNEMIKFDHDEIMHHVIFKKEDIEDKHSMYIEMSNMKTFIERYTEEGDEGFDYRKIKIS